MLNHWHFLFKRQWNDFWLPVRQVLGPFCSSQKQRTRWCHWWQAQAIWNEAKWPHRHSPLVRPAPTYNMHVPTSHPKVPRMKRNLCKLVALSDVKPVNFHESKSQDEMYVVLIVDDQGDLDASQSHPMEDLSLETPQLHLSIVEPPLGIVEAIRSMSSHRRSNTLPHCAHSNFENEALKNKRAEETHKEKSTTKIIKFLNHKSHLNCDLMRRIQQEDFHSYSLSDSHGSGTLAFVFSTI